MVDLEQDKQAVHRDRWDVEDWQQTRRDLPTLKAMEEGLEDAAWTAPRIVADVHQYLTRATPKLTPKADLAPAFRPNGRVMEQLAEMDLVEQTRPLTVGDAFSAGLATSKMGGNLQELYVELREAQEQADEAQAKADEYGDGCDQAGCQPGSPEAQADAALEAMREAAEAAQAAADATLDGLGPVIDRQLRAAAAAGQEAAQDGNEAVKGWGLDPGAMGSMDAATRLALTERLQSDRLRKVAELFGRLRAELWAETSRRWDQGPDEIADITLGRDINRLVSSELIGLCDDDLEVDFLDRFDRGRLLQYELRQRARDARGSIIYVVDDSSSMHDGSDLWACAIGLVLLDVCVRQKRGFRAIVFSGPGSIVEFDFGFDASGTTLEQRLAYAEFTLGGGTDFEGPLGRAIGALHEEYEATGRMTGDVVFATDGVCNVSETWLAKWNEQKDELKFRCFGICIGMGIFSTIEAVSDHVTSAYEMTSGKDVASVFQSVTQPKEAIHG